MNYSLTHRKEQGQPDAFILSGHLTIRNSLAIKAELLACAKKQPALQLEVKEVEEIDLAFFQLLLSLNKYLEEKQKPFTLQLTLNPVLYNLARVAGLSQTFNINPS